MLRNVRNPFGDGLHGLAGKLQRIGAQGLREVADLGGEQDRAVLLDLVAIHGAGVAGKFQALDSEVVAAFQSGVHTQAAQGFQHRRGVFGKAPFLVGASVHQETEIEIAQVVPDRPATREPSHHGDLTLFHVVIIDLGQGVLMPAHDKRRRVDIEQENILGEIVQDVFLAGDIERRVVLGADDQEHWSLGIRFLRFPPVRLSRNPPARGCVLR